MAPSLAFYGSDPLHLLQVPMLYSQYRTCLLHLFNELPGSVDYMKYVAAGYLNNFNKIIYKNRFGVLRTLFCFFNQFFYCFKRLLYCIFSVVIICYSCFYFFVSITSMQIITILLNGSYFSRIKLNRFLYSFF